MPTNRYEDINNQEAEAVKALARKFKPVLIAAGVVILLLVVWPFTIVDSTERGLKFRLGAALDGTLEPGIHFRIPVIESIKTVSVQPKQIDYSIEVGPDGSITKDNQTIGADTTVFFAYDTARLKEMWTQYGETRIISLVASAVRESMKDIIGQYSIYDVAQNQADIRGKVFTSVKAKLAAYPINVTELRIQNYDWNDGFQAAIDATMKSAQEAKKAEQDLKIAEQTAQIQVKQAEAAKQALVAKAEGEKQAVVTRAEADRDSAKLNAEAKALEGAGIRKYNEEIAKNLDVQIRLLQLEIEKIRAQQWNGQNVPTQVWSSIPFSIPTK